MPRREGRSGAGRTATLLLMGSVITVIVTAFVTGALARFAVPGPDPMPA
jgi:hypothetical protein